MLRLPGKVFVRAVKGRFFFARQTGPRGGNRGGGGGGGWEGPTCIHPPGTPKMATAFKHTFQRTMSIYRSENPEIQT